MLTGTALGERIVGRLGALRGTTERIL